MKKIIALVLTVLMMTTFTLFALGSTSNDDGADQGSGTVDQGDTSGTTDEGKADASENKTESNLGKYNVEIQSCRLAKDWEGKDVAIVKYSFTNNSDDAKSFMLAIEDAVFQNDIGLNESFMLDDSANYSSDNQTKDIKPGATLEVEVAYDLNDKTNDIVVEVSGLLSFSDAKVTKTFKIS